MKNAKTKNSHDIMFTTQSNAAKTAHSLSGVLYLSICLSPMFVASPVHGHPGHEFLPVESQSALHYFFEPVHLAPALVIGFALSIAIVVSRRFLRQRRSVSR